MQSKAFKEIFVNTPIGLQKPTLTGSLTHLITPTGTGKWKGGLVFRLGADPWESCKPGTGARRGRNGRDLGSIEKAI